MCDNCTCNSNDLEKNIEEQFMEIPQLSLGAKIDILRGKFPDNFAEVIENSMSLDREIYIGEVTEELAEGVHSWISFWNKVDDESETPVDNRLPIKIYVNSPGGLAPACMTIIDSITLSKTPVWTIGVGQVYSAGFFIFIHGHKRIAYPNASFLFHEGSLDNAGGDANRLNSYMQHWRCAIERTKKMVLNKTKITEEKYNQECNGDWWFFAEEALEHGVCDEIATTII